MPRNYQVGTKAYDKDVVALFGAICAYMAQHGYVLAANGGLVERVALEQLQKNWELSPNDARLNDSEVVSGFVNRFCRGSKEIPSGLQDVFTAFVKAR